MAFDPIERLKKGNVDFLLDSIFQDHSFLIKQIREQKNIDEVVAGFYPVLKDSDPNFCFEVIYDQERYKEKTLWLLKNKKHITLDNIKIKRLFQNTIWGKEYILTHFGQYIFPNIEELFPFILNVMFRDESKNHSWLFFFSRHSNLHVRALFMKYLIEHASSYLPLFYSDITKYMTSVTYEKGEQLSLFIDTMDQTDMCEIACACLGSNLDKSIYTKIKEKILQMDCKNDLASLLLHPKIIYRSKNSFSLQSNDQGIATFLEDPDRLFSTSRTYQIAIMKQFRDVIDKQIMDEFVAFTSHFKRNNDNFDDNFCRVCGFGLQELVKQYFEKYMDISKRKTVQFIGSGTTCSCFQIGDYVLKFIRMKWSYEKVICPNSYLIIKNLEEIYFRDKRQAVCAGLEVQPLLTRKVTKLSELYIMEWYHALEKEEYYLNEMLRGGPTGDNSFVLDSYLDADCDNPENLPDFFKEMPIVLIDRDRVYRLNNRNPKQLS